MSLDPDQRAAAEAPASVVVTAGAGTGKTHMLARRYLHHLRQGLRPLEVVAVTFTRRAAEELRARIREVVGQALAARDPALDEDVLAEVEAAPIGTVHALAQAVCRRYPDAAGVPPDFGVVDELDGALWVAEALDEALAALPDEAFGVMPFALLRATLRAALDDPTRVRAALALEPDAVREALAAVRRAAFEASVGAPAWRQEVAFLHGFEGPVGHATELARAAAVAADARLRTLGADGEALAVADAWTAMTTFRHHLGAKAGWTGPPLVDVKASLKRLRALAEAAWAKGSGGVALAWGPIDVVAAGRVDHVRGVLDAALRSVDRRKRRAKSLSFADLETHAARALADPAVRADVHRRWRALLLDEAQDVNPTQAALIDALRAPDAPLTAVGDAKQSIYGFRGAEPSVLAGLRRRVAETSDGRAVELRTSYRTHRSLVDVVNRVFERALGDEAGPLAAVREMPAWPDPAVRHRSLAEGVGDAEARADAEADAIADAIHELLDARPAAEVHDTKAPGGVRPLAVDDVAVLAAGRRALATLEARLPARGVPVLNAGGGDVLTTPEGLDVRALLRAVVDPTDGAAVAALLRSPFVAADDRALVGFATALRADTALERHTGAGRVRSRPLPWWRRLHEAEDPGLRRAAELLEDLRSARTRYGARASDLLRLADDLTGFRAVLAHLPQGGRRVADFDGMVGLLQRLEGGHADALGVVRRLERYAAAGVAVARPPLRARGAVALLTIHAAKGLEWPVVVVADLAGGGRRDAPDVILDPHVGLALRSYDSAGESAVYRYALAAQREREVAERRRLAYVAFTRARDLLVLSDRGGRREGMAAALGEGLGVPGVVSTVVPAPAGAHEAAPLPPAPAPPDPADPAWSRPGRRG